MFYTITIIFYTITEYKQTEKLKPKIFPSIVTVHLRSRETK